MAQHAKDLPIGTCVRFYPTRDHDQTHQGNIIAHTWDNGFPTYTLVSHLDDAIYPDVWEGWIAQIVEKAD